MPGRGGKQVSPAGLTLSAVLQVVDRWVTLGLVEYRRIYDGEPGWVWVTPYGLRMLQLPFARHTPAESTLPHLHQINRVRLEVERRHPGYQWISERMLRAALPRREEGSLVPHLPDAQVRAPKAIAIEVERSPKSPKELDDILTALLITGTPTADAEHPLTYPTVWYFVYPQQAYDGWRGDDNALYNRLMAMIDPGTHPYYRRITSALVSLAVHAPGGPPRSSQEFLARLDERWLKYAYAGRAHWYAQRTIKKLSEHIYDTSLTYDGFFDGIAGGLDGAIAYEDADAVFIGLDGDALKEQAVNMARYLLEDAAHYAKYRKAPGAHTLCIIDEFGALGISNVAELYEHMREAGLSMWASAQSYQGLGSERGNVLAASSIKILHRCGDPQELVKFAGQREVPAFSQMLDDERDARPTLDEPARTPSRRTTVHMQRQYAVPIEDVQQLALGTIALISGGLHAWVQVYPVALPEDLLRMATAFVSAPPQEPPPPPHWPHFCRREPVSLV